MLPQQNSINNKVEKVSKIQDRCKRYSNKITCNEKHDYIIILNKFPISKRHPVQSVFCIVETVEGLALEKVIDYRDSTFHNIKRMRKNEVGKN